MYVRVDPSGTVSFRLDYRLNGRRETVYLGKYGRDGISLARARELCLDARRAVNDGRSRYDADAPMSRATFTLPPGESDGRGSWIWPNHT